MVQLKVYDDYILPWTSADATFLDLYESQPIKLNLSIEDITNADATSAFSRTFRVPATRRNNEFFDNAWDIDGILYDVTLKKPAQILVDGAEFKVGHVRLQKIYVNSDQDRIDYELLFLGETRDFSSIIAEKPMCQLIMSDFDWPNNPVAYTNAADFVGPFGYTDITGSWDAYPENPGLTAGYADGDLLFPLIDHGNTYQGINPEQGVISIDGPDRFTQSANALALDRMKPMIRAKRIWDQIFEDSGYTYTSTFLNSNRFHQMYVSAFGNEEQIGMNVGQTTTTIFQSSNPSNTDNYVGGRMYNPVVTSNVGGYFTPATTVTGSYFTAPGTASIGGNYYLFDISAEIDAQIENSNYGYSPVPAFVQLVVVSSIGGSILQTLATGNATSNGNTSSITYDSRNGGYQIQQGDILQVLITASGGFDISEVDNTYWDCTAAPGDYYAPADLDCDYRQIDFIKDVLTMFRLVMQPDKLNPYNFIIEPWQDFIGSGTVYDWSDKLIRQKDFVSEPLFNTQSAEIEFTKQEDEDYINKFHQDNNKHAYGWLRFDSQNELLKGKREVELTGIAPTPIDQIEHGANAPHPYPQWILPTIHKHDAEGGDVLHIPIKPKTRFLFYNGTQPIVVTQDEWYLKNDVGNPLPQDTWPLVSPYEDWPVQTTSLNLNFSNDTRYYIDPSPGAGYFAQGSTLYNEYWSRYINSLYNKFSRRVTAYFTLNNVDLQDLTFDDLIFIDGKYYRPEKIIDAQIGERTAVKVQLITYKDQRPVWLDEPLTNFSVVGSGGDCFGDQGIVQVTTSGTPPFAWDFPNLGYSGSYTAPVGQAPYIFDITNVPLGTHILTVTDALGRTAQVVVTIPQSTATPVQASVSVTDPTACNAPCNGSVTVTPSGGTGPYNITWQDGGTGFTRTGLCPGQYDFVITDSLGCGDAFAAVLTCQTPAFSYILREFDPNCDSYNIDYYADYPGQLSQGDVVTLNERPGCYYVYNAGQFTPNYTIDQLYIDCPECQATQNPQQSWKGVNCEDPNDIRYFNDDWSLTPGQVVKNDDPGEQDLCFEIIEGSTQFYDHDVNDIFDSCEDCLTPTYEYAYLLRQCGEENEITVANDTFLVIGQVIKLLNYPVQDICWEVISYQDSGQPWEVEQIYADCASCTGVVIPNTCHAVKTGPIVGASGTYDRSGTTFNWQLGPNMKYVYCAQAGSFTITSGNAVISDQGTACNTSAECNTGFRPTCHEICGGGPNPEGFSQFQYTDANSNQVNVKVNDGDCKKVCGYAGTFVVVTGNGVFNDLQIPCDSDQSCN